MATSKLYHGSPDQLSRLEPRIGLNSFGVRAVCLAETPGEALYWGTYQAWLRAGQKAGEYTVFIHEVEVDENLLAPDYEDKPNGNYYYFGSIDVLNVEERKKKMR